MRAIDASVLVRLITRDDPRQAAAAEQFVGPGAWISIVALLETIWELDSVYSLQPAQIAKAIEMLLDHRDFTLQHPEPVAAALNLYRRKPALGFSDCLMLELARHAGHSPLGTFDRNLSRIEGAQRL